MHNSSSLQRDLSEGYLEAAYAKQENLEEQPNEEGTRYSNVPLEKIMHLS